MNKKQLQQLASELDKDNLGLVDAFMALFGYKPKTRKAPWFLAASQDGSLALARRPKARFQAQGKVLGAGDGFRRRIGGPSASRRAEMAEYRPLARSFVKEAVGRGLACEVVKAVPELRHGYAYGWPISARLNEVHHIFGRGRELLLWEPGWMPISKQGHRWVHGHEDEARKHGWYAPLGFWDDPRRVFDVFGGCEDWREVQRKIVEWNGK